MMDKQGDKVDMEFMNEIECLEDAMDYLMDAGVVDGLFARDCVDQYEDII